MFRKGSRVSKGSRKNQRNNKTLDYQNLEPRQLLAIDFGVNFTGSTFGSESNAIVPDAEGDTGPTHTVEVLNGRYNAYDRFNGNRVQSFTLDQFFQQAGGSIITPTMNPRVVYDETSQRFFVAAVGEGTANWIHVAFSNTSNPLDGWQTLQFVGDSTGIHFNGDLSFSVDADAVFFGTNNYSDFVPFDVSIYSIPKVDMFLPDPTLTNMSRFEGLDPALYGQTIQVAQNSEASDGMAVAIGWLDSQTVVQTNIIGPGTSAASLSLPEPINLDFGQPILPEYVPEIPHDEWTDNIGEQYRSPDAPFQDGPASWPINYALGTAPGLTASVVEVDGSVFGVHTVSFIEAVNYSGINFFEIDISDKAVKGGLPVAGEPDGTLYQALRASVLLNPYSVALRGPTSHVIRANPVNSPLDEHQYLFNPAIAVNENGLIVVTYNQINEVDNIPNISVYASVGTIVNGVNRHNIQFEAPVEIQAGFELYDLNTAGTDNWGRYGSVRVDPINDNGFFVSMPFANTSDRWSIQHSFIDVVDMAPIVEASHGNNEISVRLKPGDSSILEIVIDGVVTDKYPISAMGRPEVWGHDGFDNFLVDYTNGDPTPAGTFTDGGFVLDGGGGPDTIRTNSPEGVEYIIDKYDDLEFGTNIPAYMSTYWIRTSDDTGVSDGTYNETTLMIDVENLFGGPGDDMFIFRNDVVMIGSAHGEAGDDRFHFEDDPLFPPVSGVGDDINGGTGIDTLNFEMRETPTVANIIGYGINDGYDGRVEAPRFEPFLGPIGGDNPDDVFTEINRIEGSTMHLSDTIRFLDDVAGTYTIQDEESFYVDNDRDERMEFYQVNFLVGSTLDDTYYIKRNNVNPVRLQALQGNDEFYVNSNAPALDGTTELINDLVFAEAGPGDNLLWASNVGGSGPVDALILNNRISGLGEVAYSNVGGTFHFEITATNFPDMISLHSFLPSNTMNVYALDGDDVFSIQDLSRAFVTVYGGVGDDTYIIERILGVSFRNLELIDSIDAERDRVLIAGTVLDEVFTITQDTFSDLEITYVGIEQFGVLGRDGNDTFNILDYIGDIYIDGGGGNDVFNISSDGSGLLGNLDGFGTTNIEIDGGTGINRLNVSNFGGIFPLRVDVFADRITGLWDGDLVYYSSGGSFTTPSGAIGGIMLRGSDVEDDSFNVRELAPQHSLLLEGVGGEDEFTVRSAVLGDVRASGGLDPDMHDIFFGVDPTRRVEIIDEPTPIENRVDFYGDDTGETIIVDTNMVTRGGESIFLSGGFTFASVAAFGGNDDVTLVNSPAETFHLYAGTGDDDVLVSGSVGANGLRFVLDSGADNINVRDTEETTFTRVLGGTGDDIIRVGAAAEGTVIADGEGGSDRYNIDYVGNGSRWVDTRDSGIGGNDVTFIRGTAITDHIEVRANRILRLNEIRVLPPETVAFGTSNESVVVDTRDGLDLIQVFASVAGTTRVNGGEDADTAEIFSTTHMNQLTLDMGRGQDEVNVFSTHVATNTSIFGRDGHDMFTVGSDEANDNGNLGLLRGRVLFRGGSGFDQMYVNDRASAGAYSYYVGPTGLSSIPGPLGLDRDAFAGLSYNGELERIRLDTTDLANFISVRASEDTEIHIDGNAPSGNANVADFIYLLGSSADGRQFQDGGNGSGSWDFSDGKQDVSFEDIEDFFDSI